MLSLVEQLDQSKLQETLSDTAQWAKEELESREYRIKSHILFEIDPSLKIMGCANKMQKDRR